MHCCQEEWQFPDSFTKQIHKRKKKTNTNTEIEIWETKYRYSQLPIWLLKKKKKVKYLPKTLPNSSHAVISFPEGAAVELPSTCRVSCQPHVNTDTLESHWHLGFHRAPTSMGSIETLGFQEKLECCNKRSRWDSTLLLPLNSTVYWKRV